MRFIEFAIYESNFQSAKFVFFGKLTTFISLYEKKKPPDCSGGFLCFVNSELLVYGNFASDYAVANMQLNQIKAIAE
jgi:hypothetical protein